MSYSSTNKIIDLIMFMGQSNMAGRGTAAQAPIVPSGYGYEFKAITDANKLFDIVEPFGQWENLKDGINDLNPDGTTKRTGSMVSAFVNAYYDLTQTPIVGVCASEGGTRICYWQPNTPRSNDAINRFQLAKDYLTSNDYTIRHKYIVWCQGESDGDAGLTKEEYKTAFQSFAEYWTSKGIEKIFIIRIGNQRDNASLYDNILLAQTELGKEYNKCVLISTKFAGFAAAGLMKDKFHYVQEAYNQVGTEAGTNLAFYVNNKKEPTMYDIEYDNLYYSKK